MLTYEEWLQIWINSGHLNDRGRKRDQYCMARYGDKGPYAVGNVKIITCFENNSEKEIPELLKKYLSGPRSEQQKRKTSCTMRGRTISEQHRKKLSNALRGKIVSPETKQKLREAWVTRKTRSLNNVS